MLWDILRDIFLNQFLFPLQLLIATLIYTWGKKRRAAFKRKLFVGLLLFALVNALVAWLPAYVNLLIKFAAVILYVHLCYDMSYGQAAFDSTCSYATQHLAYQFSLIAAGLLRLGIWEQLAAQCLVFAAVYAVAYFGFAKKIRELDSTIAKSRVNIITMVALLFFAITLTVFTMTLPPANIVTTVEKR